MLGKTESLNASVATGIILYEYVRQLGTGQNVSKWNKRDKPKYKIKVVRLRKEMW